MDALGFLSVKQESNVVVLMFLSGLLPDCYILRLQPLSGKVLHELRLECPEYSIICMGISFRESDIVSHKEHLTLGLFCVIKLSFNFCKDFGVTG